MTVGAKPPYDTFVTLKFIARSYWATARNDEPPGASLPLRSLPGLARARSTYSLSELMPLAMLTSSALGSSPKNANGSISSVVLACAFI